MRFSSLVAISRASEWWNYKLTPALAILYGAMFYYHVPSEKWLLCQLILLGALIPGAIFVSVVNDLADRADDARAGKANRLASAGPVTQVLALGAPIAVGLAWCVLWRDEPLLLALYIAAWLAFAAYSLPPLRLKRRGWAGVMADATGAHLLPALLALALAAEAAGRVIAPPAVMLVGVWALAYGLRGIFWHQLYDSDNDRVAGVATLASRMPPEALQRLTRRWIFPFEAAALLALLAVLQLLPAWVALALYLVLVGQRIALWRQRPILAVPDPRGLILLAEYYTVLLPVSLLLAAVTLDPVAAAALLALHVLLFHRAIWRSLKDFVRLEKLQAGALVHAIRSRSA